MITKFFGENAFLLFRFGFDNVFVEDVVVCCFKDSFRRQLKVLGGSLKCLASGSRVGDKVPNGQVSTLYPELPPPIIRTGFKIFVSIAMLAHKLVPLKQSCLENGVVS